MWKAKSVVFDMSDEDGWKRRNEPGCLDHLLATEYPDVKFCKPGLIRVAARAATSAILLNAAVYTVLDKVGCIGFAQALLAAECDSCQFSTPRSSPSKTSAVPALAPRPVSSGRSCQSMELALRVTLSGWQGAFSLAQERLAEGYSPVSSVIGTRLPFACMAT